MQRSQARYRPSSGLYAIDSVLEPCLQHNHSRQPRSCATRASQWWPWAVAPLWVALSCLARPPASLPKSVRRLGRARAAWRVAISPQGACQRPWHGACGATRLWERAAALRRQCRRAAAARALPQCHQRAVQPHTAREQPYAHAPPAAAPPAVYELEAVGADGKLKLFTKPWAMTLIMFMGARAGSRLAAAGAQRQPLLHIPAAAASESAKQLWCLAVPAHSQRMRCAAAAFVPWQRAQRTRCMGAALAAHPHETLAASGCPAHAHATPCNPMQPQA